jgi:hypothetical protein
MHLLRLDFGFFFVSNDEFARIFFEFFTRFEKLG